MTSVVVTGFAERKACIRSSNSKVTDFPSIEDILLRCSAGQGICIPPAMMATAYLAARGIEFQVPIGTIPGQQQQSVQTSARVCFDRVHAYSDIKSGVFSFDDYLKKFNIKNPEPEKIDPDLNKYYSDLWDFKYNSTNTAKHYACDDAAVPWISLGCASQSNAGAAANPAMPLSLCIGGCGASRMTGQLAAGNKSGSPRNKTPMYEFYDGYHIIQIFLRSTWGIYQDLGQLVRRQEIDGTVNILGGINSDPSLFRVVRGRHDNCFASVVYSDETYCIPKDAYNSKQIISVVHELANLYTKPNNQQQPNTGTTRVTQ
jgi:hypothetical protein